MYFYTVLLRGFRKEAIDCFLKFLYNRRSTPPPAGMTVLPPVRSCVCILYLIYYNVQNNIQIPAVYTDCDIYLHTGENCIKEKKRYSPPQPCPLPSEGNSKHTSYCLSFTVRRRDTLLAFVLVTTPWMCVCVCVNLWKLYYANCYLSFF